eukprot:scaffold104659_cov27-Tisochrysis_lutea.AAC.1
MFLLLVCHRVVTGIVAKGKAVAVWMEVERSHSVESGPSNSGLYTSRQTGSFRLQSANGLTALLPTSFPLPPHSLFVGFGGAAQVRYLGPVSKCEARTGLSPLTSYCY